jgi:hypothetical protein
MHLFWVGLSLLHSEKTSIRDTNRLFKNLRKYEYKQTENHQEKCIDNLRYLAASI